MPLENDFTRKAKYLAPENCRICQDHIFTLERLGKEDARLFGLVQHNFDKHLKSKHNIDAREK